MDPVDAAEAVRDAAPDNPGAASEEERFRSRAALLIAMMAALLAIASLVGDNAVDEMIHSNIRASDTWAFFQAKNIRQTANELAAAELEAELLMQGGISPEARARVEASIAEMLATVARYEDEPDPDAPGDLLRGEGKRQLSAQATEWERRRDRAAEQDANLDYAAVLLQIAIVLGSVAILANSRGTLRFALALSGIACLLVVNGMFLLVTLPF